MDLLSFTGQNQFSLLLSSFLCIACLLTFESIGKLLVRDDPLVTQSVVGVSVVATINIFAISFFAVLAKYIIFISIALSLVLFIKNHKSNDYVKYIKSCCICFLFFAFFYLTYIFIIAEYQRFYNYNSHTPYFYGVQVEIFKAEYWSRLKILDNFPISWSKYHFFNGSFMAFFLAFFEKKDVITTVVSKIIVISLFFTAIFEQLRSKLSLEKAVALLCLLMTLCLTIMKSTFAWSIITNNYSSLFFIVLIFFAFYKEKYANAFIFSLIFAVSTSRSIIPGFVLFVYSAFHLYKYEMREMTLSHRNALCFTSLLVFFAILVTLLTSYDTQGAFQPNFTNFFNPGWLTLVPFLNGNALPIQKLYLLSYLYISYLYLSQNKLFLNYKNITVMFATVILSMFSGEFFIFIFAYLFPVLIIFYSDNVRIKKPLLVFYCVAILQIYFFEPGISFPNYGFVFYLLFFILFEKSVKYNNFLSYKNSIILFIALLFLNKNILFVTPNYSKYGEPIELSTYHNDEIFIYKGSQDEKSARLHVLKGGRVTFFEERAKKDSMGRSFAKPSAEELLLLDKIRNSTQ